MIFFDLFLGLIFDTFGRKIPIGIGFIVSGVCINMMPFFNEVYEQFLPLRIFATLGCIPGVNSPLIPDYIKSNSLGLANAYVNINTPI